MRKFAVTILMTMSILIGTAQLQADDSDLFTVRVSPDALIVLDLSGSMGAHPGGDYSWAGDCATGPYYITSGPGYTNQCHTGDFSCGDSSACTGPFYKKVVDNKGVKRCDTTDHKTDCSKLAIAKRAIYDLLDDNDDGKDSNQNKNYIDKKDEESLNIRIGYMRFYQCETEDPINDWKVPPESPPSNYKSGGCQTIQREIYEQLDGQGNRISLDYKGLWTLVEKEKNEAWTPLTSALYEAALYLNEHKASDNAKACRQKYIILITDGWDTLACGGIRGVSENTTGSFAYKRRRATLAKAKAAYDAGYKVFVIGFGSEMPDTERNTLEWSAYYGGTDNPLVDNSGNTSSITPSSAPCQKHDGCTPDQPHCTNAPNDPGYKDLSGYAFLAQDATKLSQALSSIFRDITEKAFFYAAPTIPSVRTVAEDIAYLSSFTPSNTPFWQGSLKAYQLNPDGTLPVDEKGYINVNPIWDAFQKLNGKPHGSRLIFTYVNGAKKDFIYDNLSNGDLGVGTDQDRANLINHVRGGIDAYDVDQDGNKSELRSWKLGDIFHSTAVIIGKPSPSFIDSGYNGAGGFYESNKERTKVVIAGANDGMLHAFHAGDWNELEGKYVNGTGEEKWAFIPNALLPNLKLMTSAHTYYVDGSPRVSDVWFYSNPDQSGENKSKDEWKTVLICGLRKGGKHYFALDVTDTEKPPQYLWEFPSPNKNYTYETVLAKIGQSWSDPAIGRVKIEVSGKLYERWVAFIGGGFDKTNDTGKAFFVLDITNGNILKEFSGTGMDFSFAAPPTALDTNFDGYIDKVYIGDLAGQMWVFDVSSNDITKWEGKILFLPPGAPAPKNPIYYQAAAALDPQRNLWVYFGTGDREDPTNDNCRENFYAVKDDGKGDYPRKKGDLANVTATNTFTIDPLRKGWYIELSKGEKVLAKPAVFRELVYFTTYSPKTSTDPCIRAGNAAFYIVEYLSGGGAFDLGEYLVGNPSDRSAVIGEGIPSTPVISVGSKGDAVVIVRTTSGGGGPGSGSGGGPGRGAGGGGATAPPDENPKKVLYWREVVW